MFDEANFELKGRVQNKIFVIGGIRILRKFVENHFIVVK